MTNKILLESDFFRVEHDPTRKLVIMRRSARSMSPRDHASALELDEAIDELIAALRPVRGQRFLVDVRRAPGNNDPTVEQRVQRFRRRLFELFPVSATIVATATGRLQLLRMARERGEASGVFLDEEEAIQSLLGRPL
jgi:hypothetical protein